MKSLLIFMAGLLVVGVAIAAPSSSGSGPLSPYESVQSSTNLLLKKLVQVQHLYASDPELFFLEVDSSLAPFIDFKGFARGVMAKYYRRANDQQKERFAETFRNSLIRTYAKALVEFDNEQVTVKTDNTPQKDPRKARVSLEVHGKEGAVYPVEYSLVLIGDQWKLRNIVINGINIGLQFRSQFSAYMQQYKNDIDKVIDNWSVDA
jgi:phospholipid transport system substrate-binding protein